jgi:hypothetical protein
VNRNLRSNRVMKSILGNRIVIHMKTDFNDDARSPRLMTSSKDFLRADSKRMRLTDLNRSDRQ